MKDVVRNLSDKISRMFPESTVLEYLLNAKNSVFLTVEDYIKIHATVPFIHLYQGNSTVLTANFFWGNLKLRSLNSSLDPKRSMGANLIRWSLNKNGYLFQSIYNIKKTSPFCFTGYMKFLSDVAKLITYTNSIRMVLFLAKAAGQTRSFRRNRRYTAETVLPCTS